MLSPYHPGSLGLLRQLERTAGLSLPTAELADQAEQTRQRIDAAVAGNPEHLQLLHGLEQRYDAYLHQEGDLTVPVDEADADELVEEVEQFLREQRPNE